MQFVVLFGIPTFVYKTEIDLLTFHISICFVVIVLNYKLFQIIF